MEEIGSTFEFRQCVSILKSTGRSARTLRELRNVMEEVSDESLYHHTYQYFLKDHVHEYTNDFAYWAGESLEERALAEHLSNIDPYSYENISGLRQTILSVIDDYLVRFPEPREALPGEEFYFNETVTIIFPAGVKARNLAEFLIGIRYVDSASIYYHFFEARVRLHSGTDDFSLWIGMSMNKPVLAAKIRAIDPFMHSIESIREHIMEAVEQEVKSDMEGIRQ